jgi:hypothetical protein
MENIALSRYRVDFGWDFWWIKMVAIDINILGFFVYLLGNLIT